MNEIYERHACEYDVLGFPGGPFDVIIEGWSFGHSVVFPRMAASC